MFKIGLFGLFKKDFEEVKGKEQCYLKMLENAKTNVEIFKYLLLVDSKALARYVLQTRLQAEQSFILGIIISVIGFIIIAVGISLGINITAQGGNTLDAAYLAALAGILTEFISGVFLYLYNKTLQQMNVFHERLLASKKVALDYLAESMKAPTKIKDTLQSLRDSAEKRDLDKKGYISNRQLATYIAAATIGSSVLTGIILEVIRTFLR